MEAQERGALSGGGRVAVSAFSGTPFTHAPMADPNTSLLWALLNNDEAGAREALAAGADVNLASPTDSRPLHAAALRGPAPLVSLLVSKGARVDQTDNEGFTPLMVAALNGRLEAVTTLLAHKADPALTRLDTGETALHLAMAGGSGGVVTALLKAGADVIAQTIPDKHTPLHLAAEFNAQHLAKLLLGDPVCDPTLEDEGGHTAAQVARQHGHQRLAEHLDMCTHKEDPDSPNIKLVLAILNSDEAGAREALAAGADINLASPTDSRPLHAAALRGSAPLVSLLVSKGARVDQTDNEGFTPLMVAALNGRLEAVTTLLAHKADPALTRRDTGETALHLAMAGGSGGVVTALLEAGADINAQTIPDKHTPLHLAAEFNAQHLAKLLMDQPNCCTTMRDKDGCTAAAMAATHGHQALSRLLGLVPDSVDTARPSTDPKHCSMGWRVRCGPPVPAGPNVYRCLSQPRGLVLIINTFEDESKYEGKILRKGSRRDRENLQEVFTKMGYRVFSYVDLNKETTLAKLNELRQHRQLSEVDSVVVCVMSHGLHGRLLTADTQLLPTRQIISMFTDQNCPDMKNKPKIFIFNFCRGDGVEAGSLVDPSINTCKRQPDAESEARPVPGVLAADEPVNVVDVARDTYVINAATDGVMAIRDMITGSYLINNLCKVLAAYAHNTSVSDMTNKLVQFMLRERATTPEMTHSLAKRFYFNPHVHAPTKHNTPLRNNPPSTVQSVQKSRDKNCLVA